jgi:hypothetical protein
MDDVEEQLRYSLVAFVGGSWLVASPAQVMSHLLRHWNMSADEVQVPLYRAGSFHLYFHEGATTDLSKWFYDTSPSTATRADRGDSLIGSGHQSVIPYVHRRM